MQDLAFAINLECLHSSLQAKLPMHNFTRAKHAKTCFCSNSRILKVQSCGNMMQIYKNNEYRSIKCRIFQNPRNDKKLKTVNVDFLLSILSRAITAKFYFCSLVTYK